MVTGAWAGPRSLTCHHHQVVLGPGAGCGLGDGDLHHVGHADGGRGVEAERHARQVGRAVPLEVVTRQPRLGLASLAAGPAAGQQLGVDHENISEYWQCRCMGVY